MALRAYVSYSVKSGGVWTRYSSAPITWDPNDWTTMAAAGRHIIMDDVPTLTEDIENNLGEFATGDMTFTVCNDTGFWTPGGTSGPFATMDPYLSLWVGDANAKPVIIALYIDVLVWQGVVDFSTVVWNPKTQTVTFTARGGLAALEGLNAETIRRTIPDQCWFGRATGAGEVAAGTLYYVDDSSAAWVADSLIGHALIDILGAVFRITDNTATRITYAADASHFAVNDTVMVRPIVVRTYLHTNVATGSGAGYLNVSTALTEHAWEGYYIEDGAGAFFGPVTHNTTSQFQFASGTPASSGTIYVRKSPSRRLVELMTPHTPGTAWTVRELLLESGDGLRMVCVGANQGEAGSYVGQEVTIEFAPLEDGASTSVGAGVLNDTSKAWTTDEWVGKYLRDSSGVVFDITANSATQLTWSDASAPAAGDYTILTFPEPALTRQQLWLMDDFSDEFLPRDVLVCTTPYYRNKTPEYLVGLFAAATGLAWKILITPYTTYNNLVPYADFEGKSALEALSELAIITNCTLSCTHIDGITWFIFCQRDRSPWPQKNLVGMITEGEITGQWDQCYQCVKVTGIDGRSVIRGAPRYGCKILEVSTDMVDSYPWLRQIADRLWAYFGVQRDYATVKVLGDYQPSQTITFNGDMPLPPTAATGWAEYLGTMADDWQVTTDPANSANRIMAGWPLTDHDAAISSILAGTPTDVDVYVDLRTNYAGSPWPQWGLLFRGSGASWYAAVVQLHTTPANSSLLIRDQAGTSLGATLKTLGKDTWYRMHLQVVGTVARMKVYSATANEPETWDLTYSGLVKRAGVFGLYCNSSAVDNLFDNLRYRASRINPLDDVTLTGTDSWLVWGVTEPLGYPPAEKEYRLIRKTGTTYTPSDDAVLDIDAIPEPPVIDSVVAAGGTHYHATITWPFPRDSVVFAVVQLWNSGQPRPAGGFAVTGSGLFDYLGSNQFEVGILPGTFGSPSGSYLMVDIAVVLADGRVSFPSEPYRFAHI